jgi:hypothetical protein
MEVTKSRMRLLIANAPKMGTNIDVVLTSLVVVICTRMRLLLRFIERVVQLETTTRTRAPHNNNNTQQHPFLRHHHHHLLRYRYRGLFSQKFIGAKLI